MKLSNRLTVIFENLLPQKQVWDVCCDHGYLGMSAYKTENFPGIYFVDQVSTIIEQTQQQFNQHVYHPESKTSVHFICQNAENINTIINGTLCISGVGGLIIFKILERLSTNGFLNADRLIVGPQRDELKLAELIKNSPTLNRYQAQAKIEVMENGRMRFIFVFDKN